MRTRQFISLMLGLLSAFRLCVGKEPQGATQNPKFWYNPKLRIEDYPFVDVSGKTLHKTLWQDYPEVPEWGQRGRLIYFTHYLVEREKIPVAKLKEQGGSLLHGWPKADDPIIMDLRQCGLPLVVRLDGEMFFGDYMHRPLIGLDRPSAYGRGEVVYHPECDWFRKYPLSWTACRILRDGQPQLEYWGSKWAIRRDINYMHPVSLQIREATFREALLGEQVFDQPIQCAHRDLLRGVWWDNPGNVAESYDPYSMEYFAGECRKRFREKYHQRFMEWFGRQPSKYQAQYATPESREEAFRKKFELWFYDPPRLISDYQDHEMERWWNKLWADAYAGYYAWQYKYLQEEIAPKLGLKHLFVGGNFKLCWSMASWDYYAVSKNIVDLMGACETSVQYSNKQATGYKLALAASNGKPGGRWRSFRSENDLITAEAMACLGVLTNPQEHLLKFHMANMDLYHNAKPGAKIAYLYHLEDGLHHSEIANVCRLTDQIWRAGLPLEIITENHLQPEVLKGFSVLLLPGFTFTGEEAGTVKDFIEKGGTAVLIGDNRDGDGKALGEMLAGLEGFADGKKNVGQGRVIQFGTQLITAERMKEAMEEACGDSVRLAAPAGEDILVNILTQPAKGLTGIHLVNFSGKEQKNVTVRLPMEFGSSALVWISPYGGHQLLEGKDEQATVPSLGVYGVLVGCKEAKQAEEILARNRECVHTLEGNELPTIGKVMDGKNKMIFETQTDLSGLAPGRKLCHLRQFSKTCYRRLDADVIAGGKGKVGVAQDIVLKILAISVWTPNDDYLDKLAIVAIRASDGRREVIPITLEPIKGGVEGKDMRETDVQMPVGCFIGAESRVEWTPAEAGRYQLYLSYRYVSEPYQGKPDMREDKQYPLNNYFFGHPRVKITSEDKLPCLVVDVEP